MPRSFAKKHGEMITNLAELAGFGVVPDQRYHQTSLKPDGYVALFDGGHSQDFEPSTSFYQISLALRLGAMVATINGYVDKREVDTLLTIIEQDTTTHTHTVIYEQDSFEPVAQLIWVRDGLTAANDEPEKNDEG